MILVAPVAGRRIGLLRAIDEILSGLVSELECVERWEVAWSSVVPIETCFQKGTRLTGRDFV